MGSTIAAVGRDGVVVERYEYDDFGVPSFFDGAGAPIPASAIGNPVLYAGARWDADLQLYYMRHRWYDPALGRFLSRDPLGLWGDALNLGNGTTYVGHSPWTYVDPMGLWSLFSGPRLGERCKQAVLSGNVADYGNDFKLGGNGSQIVVAYGTAIDYGAATGRALGSVAETVGREVTGTDTALSAWEAGQAAYEGDYVGAGVSALGVLPFVPGTVGKLAGKAPSTGKVRAPAKRDSGVTVLGRYPEYVNMANTNGDRYFDIPMEHWNRMTKEQQWEANKMFLDRTIQRGDLIKLASNPNDSANAGSYFAREIEYLREHGYCVSPDGKTIGPGGNRQ